jgi:hypothetical protein
MDLVTSLNEMKKSVLSNSQPQKLRRVHTGIEYDAAELDREK